MDRRQIVTAFASSALSFLVPSLSFAQEDHLSQAKEHTREAIGAGVDGQASSLTEHATAALEHANSAQEEKPNKFIKSGIAHLNQAIKYGKGGNAKIATTHAKAALAQFEHAPK